MSKAINYLGQLRVYSLIDLMLMLVAAGASPASLRFWGAVFLWVGFLAYLESEHHDEGRESVPNKSAWLLLLLGLMWWKDSVTGYLFVICSVCYAQKKKRPWGLLSPFLRGVQSFVLVGALTGFNQGFPWCAALLTAVRNWLGDVRDSTEDAEDKICTWPVKFGWQSWPFVHLFGVYSTSITWWLFADGVSIWLLAAMLIIEIAAYWFTPRPSNKNANLSVRGKILLYHGRWGG